MPTRRLFFWTTVLGLLAVFVLYLLKSYENSFGHGWGMRDTARIVIHDWKFGGRAVRRAISYGDKILPLLIEGTNNFDIETNYDADAVNLRNAYWIADVLGAIQTRQSQTILMDLYSRPDLLARLVGAIGLAQHGKLPEDIDEQSFLVETIRDWPGCDEQALAIIALGKSGNRKAVPFLLEILCRKGVDQRNAGYVCQALARLDAHEAIGVLREYMQEHGPLREAFRALISLGDREAVPLAISGITPDLKGMNGEFIVDELKAVTGRDYGLDREAWQRWWKSVEGKWKVPEKFLNAYSRAW